MIKLFLTLVIFGEQKEMNTRDLLKEAGSRKMMDAVQALLEAYPKEMHLTYVCIPVSSSEESQWAGFFGFLYC